jgi:predicted NUDIX family NTP pyrophosphohydrolase
MTVESSGLLLHRINSSGERVVLLGHMGGPFWAKKNAGAWSIPKGLHDAGETDHLAVAEREFAEEMGSAAPTGATVDLGSVTSGNKAIRVFARQGDFDADAAHSNTFEMEWPPKSGTIQAFPEIDRAAWVLLAEARELLTKSQAPLVDRLVAALAG